MSHEMPQSTSAVEKRLSGPEQAEKLEMEKQGMDEAHTDVSWHLDIKKDNLFPVDPETKKRETKKVIADPVSGMEFTLEMKSNDEPTGSILITAPYLQYDVSYF